jgi:hypothetical protein
MKMDSDRLPATEPATTEEGVTRDSHPQHEV